MLFLLLVLSCKSNLQQSGNSLYSMVEGETMGTYYRITYSDTISVQNPVDSILRVVNQEVSTYIPDSRISLFNHSMDTLLLEEGIFLDNYRISKELYKKSKGYYDPTVMPLVNYWGFGYAGKKPVEDIDSLAILSIRTYVGMNKIIEQKTDKGVRLIKSNPGIELDFSSVAKGYAVDLVAKYLENTGIRDFLIDIGGEMVLKGVNPKGEVWSIGINTPSENASLTDAINYLQVTDKALATSGNYRNFYESHGEKISHTINPLTGFPERSNLLSVSIIAPECGLADAWATTCMVLGMSRAEAALENETNIDACFIYAENDTLKTKYINHFTSYLKSE